MSNALRGLSSLLDRLAAHGARIGVAVAVLIAVLGTGLALNDGTKLKSNDERDFLDLSGNVAKHLQFAHTNTPTIEGYEPSLPEGALRPTAYRAPGYVVFQAPFRLLGLDFVGLRVANYLLVGATVILLYGLLSRRFSARAGLLSSLLVLAYPALLYAAGTLYPQTLSAFLLVATLYLLDRCERGARLGIFAAAGLVYGCLVLTVPIYLLLTPIVVGWLYWPQRVRWLEGAVTAACIVAMVGVWSARDIAVFKTPMALGTSSGFNLLAGNCPNTRPDQTSVDVRFPDYVYTELTGKDEVERDRVYARAALRFVTENPGHAAKLYVGKFLYWFAFRNELLSDKVVKGGAGAGPGWLRDAVMFVSYGGLLGLALVRTALTRRFPWSSLEGLLAALYVGGGLAYAIYFTRIRFRLPFDWLLIALDAVFLARVLGSMAPADPAKRASASLP